MMLMARLPHYVELEADFAGRTKMLNVLSTLYNFPSEYAQSRRDTQQYDRISADMQKNPQVKSLVERLESDYDARRGRRQQQSGEGFQAEEPKDENLTPLPPSVEQFLGELGNFGNENT